MCSGAACAAALPSSREAIAAALGDKSSCGAEVREVAPENGARQDLYATERGVETVSRGRRSSRLTADVATRVIDDPPQAAATLGAHHVRPDGESLSVPYQRDAPMPWDDVYSILVVGKSFNMFFNHASALRDPGKRASAGRRR